MSTNALELINIHKKIGKKQIIEDVSFHLQEGEVFGLIGPNGAGKTTIIRMIVGLMKLTKGDIKIFGHSIQNNFVDAIQYVGAIVENPEMYPLLTGWQNLKQYARMIPGISEDKIQEVIELVGLKKAIHQQVKRYSLGMRQRLGIAQALLHQPKVLILDEPTNGLDPAGIREIRQYIRRLATEGKVAVLISSHLLSEIELICDRIGILQRGKLINIQKVQEESQFELDKLREVKIEVLEIEEALQILKETFHIEALRTENTVTFQTKKQSIPKILRAFIKQELTVYQVATKQLSLEDKFFEAIGENVIE